MILQLCVQLSSYNDVCVFNEESCSFIICLLFVLGMGLSLLLKILVPKERGDRRWIYHFWIFWASSQANSCDRTREQCKSEAQDSCSDLSLWWAQSCWGILKCSTKKENSLIFYSPRSRWRGGWSVLAHKTLLESQGFNSVATKVTSSSDIIKKHNMPPYCSSGVIHSSASLDIHVSKRQQLLSLSF